MIEPGRKYSAESGYRYGFNGKENDKDISEGKLDFGARIIDVRLGKWLSTDPIIKAFITPYNFAGNNPVNFIDPDGEDEIHFYYTTKTYYKDGKLFRGVLINNRPALAIQIIRKEGPHTFFYHNVEKTMNMTKKKVPLKPSEFGYGTLGDGEVWTSKETGSSEKITQFYPDINSNGRSGKSSGVTQTYGIVDDDDVVSLMKLGNNELFDYLERTRPGNNYESLSGMKQVMSIGNFLVGVIVSGAMIKIAGGVFGLMSREISLSKYATMTNSEARIWYNTQLKSLNIEVSFTEANARALSGARNSLKAEGRLMMADRKAAEALEVTDPLRPFEYYIEKYTKEGYSGESLWQKIITGSAKPNSKVNAQFGIK